MLIKVYGGTAVQQDDGLCDTCRHSKIVRGRRLEEEVVFCSAMGIDPQRILFKVTTCTDYVDAREPSYHELLEKAWILRPPTKRRPAGFVRAGELRGEEAALVFSDPTEKE